MVVRCPARSIFIIDLFISFIHQLTPFYQVWAQVALYEFQPHGGKTANEQNNTFNYHHRVLGRKVRLIYGGCFAIVKIQPIQIINILIHWEQSHGRTNELYASAISISFIRPIYRVLFLIVSTLFVSCRCSCSHLFIIMNA